MSITGGPHRLPIDRPVKTNKNLLKRAAAALALLSAQAVPAASAFRFDSPRQPLDAALARQWYQKAALEGDAYGQYSLALVYRDGRGGPVDYEAAIGWMRGAADAGVAPAQNDLGAMLQHGQGEPQNFVEAKTWYEKAEAQGQRMASFNLASLAYAGNGMARDRAAALRWAREGGECDNSLAARIGRAPVASSI